MPNAFVSSASALAKRIFRNANDASQPPEAQVVNDSETSSPEELEEEVPARFLYEPKNFAHRLVVGIGAKSKLATSVLVSIPYRAWMRWMLISILIIITVFLTPQLLPKWLGFKWSTPEDLCQNRDNKLKHLKEKMLSLAKVEEGERFVSKVESALKCMDDSASNTWNGRGSRILYARDCIPANAQPQRTEKTVCVGPESRRECVRVKFVFSFKLQCKTIRIPEKCETIEITDPKSVEKIAELKAARNEQAEKQSAAAEQVEEISDTADKAGERIINRLIVQVDIASNLYIIYSMLAIIVGTPVIIFKRERSARVIGSALGMRKANFIVFIVILLTIYDSGIKMLRDTNFSELFRNFQNDPCYLDPKFSQARLALIQETCGNVTNHRLTVADATANMTSVYYDSELCQLCVTPGKQAFADPTLVQNVASERELYIEGTRDGYKYPGNCNSTALNEETKAAPDSGLSFTRAFLGSGVLAQILLKGILASFVVHLIGFLEPMTTHRGIVEIFGFPRTQKQRGDVQDEEPHELENSEFEENQEAVATLTKREISAVERFARDKHLTPLIITSILMVWEAVVIIYSIVEAHRKSGSLIDEVQITDPGTVAEEVLNCVRGKLT